MLHLSLSKGKLEKYTKKFVFSSVARYLRKTGKFCQQRRQVTNYFHFAVPITQPLGGITTFAKHTVARHRQRRDFQPVDRETVQRSLRSGDFHYQQHRLPKPDWPQTIHRTEVHR